MPKITSSKTEKIQFWATPAQKKQLERLAQINNKSLTQHLLDAGLSLGLDAAKADFYQNINDNLTHLKKTQLVITRLLLLIGAEELKDQDTIRKFYDEAVEDAEKRFGEG